MNLKKGQAINKYILGPIVISTMEKKKARARGAMVGKGAILCLVVMGI